VDKTSTSFFVTNFPEDLVWGDLWKLFAKFGSVCDVFIPKKVDKWGRRFGFVKFKEVKEFEVELLSKKLEDVWWDKFKLKINRARFGKGEEKEGSTAGNSHTQRLLPENNRRVGDDLSFKSLLLGQVKNSDDAVAVKEGMAGDGDGGRKKKRVLSIGELVPLEIPIQDQTMSLLKQSMVGLFKETMDFQTFHDRLIMEGQHEVKATYMGGSMVLLQCSSEGELSEVLKFNKQWWDNCFRKIIPWRPNLLSECRETWIQIFGIPLHAWEEYTFKMVAGRFGVFLDFDEATVSKQRLDLARVKLRSVRRGLIDTVLQLKVEGELFDVWVVEERCGCGDDRRIEVGEGDRSIEISNSNSGEGVWRGDDGDVFSDGRTESDNSEAYEVSLGLQDEGGKKTAEAGVIEGIRNVDIPSQPFLDMMVKESVAGEQVGGGHVEEVGEGCSQIPRQAEVVGDSYGAQEVEVGPVGEFSNCGVLAVKDQAGCPICVGSSSPLVREGVGPVGPANNNWNPFVDLVEEDQQAQSLNELSEDQMQGASSGSGGGKLGQCGR
jgi:hypothetical protein